MGIVINVNDIKKMIIALKFFNANLVGPIGSVIQEYFTVRELRISSSSLANAFRGNSESRCGYTKNSKVPRRRFVEEALLYLNKIGRASP
jgi:hypothetical protein